MPRPPSSRSRFAFLHGLASPKHRWAALAIISLGYAIVVIDNTILNVSIPYILRDLNSSFLDIQWAISGYALTIATILITVGRIGDIVGRKKLFLIGIVIFAIGSLIASASTNATMLILGRAVIQAVGAAIMLTMALALLATEFHGKERAVALGIWGAVAGASATIGPLLGGFLTTTFSWRWSLRINLIVAIAAVIGSVVIMESRGERGPRFDWLGTILSGGGLFLLVFAFIEGQTFGWLTPVTSSVFGFTWPFSSVSIIPFFFLGAIVLLTLFVVHEVRFERRGCFPHLSMRLFKRRGFFIGSFLILLLYFTLFSVFFNLPIYLENVLGYDSFSTGLVFLSTTVAIFIMAITTGFLATRIPIKWLVVTGLALLAVGAFLLVPEISLTATSQSLAPALIFIGIGFGLCSAQLNNVIISSVPVRSTGQASATSITMQQIGAAVGVAVIGSLLATSLLSSVVNNVQADAGIPFEAKPAILQNLKNVDVESGKIQVSHGNPGIQTAIAHDVHRAIVSAMQSAMQTVFYFLVVIFIISLFLPAVIHEEESGEEREGKTKASRIPDIP
jgi:EmrB/QacA subfamily drug resistance transporter